MRDILTVSFNPALDISTSVEEVRPDIKLRCDRPRYDPGGGGLNVARAVSILGGHAMSFIALGGGTGEALRQLVAAEGIPILTYPAPGETRHSFAVEDRTTGHQFRFTLPGPVWSPDDLARAVAAIDRATPEGAVVVLSGSGPLGAPASLYLDIMTALADKSPEVIIDTSGTALSKVAAGGVARPHVLRMDDEEAAGLAGKPMASRRDAADFAEALVVKGIADRVIVALGADGSVMADGARRLHVTAPKVPVRSKIGAGDSFVGAFALSLARGDDDAEALRLGATSAAAAVMTEGTELCRASDVEALLPQAVLSEV